MRRFVVDRLTRLTAGEAISALATAYRRLFGVEVDAPTLAILVAQSALETGHWKSIHCYNFGNVKGSDPETGLYTMYACNERLSPARTKLELSLSRDRSDGSGLPDASCRPTMNDDGTWTVDFWPDHRQCEFRAYESAAAGALEHLEFLAVDTTPDNERPNRYADAWRAAEDDDPEAFAVELRRAGYYTAPVDQYKNTLMAVFNRYLPACRRFLEEHEPTVVDSPKAPEKIIDAGRVLDLVALTLARGAREFRIEKP